jgi:hypothetical protein
MRAIDMKAWLLLGACLSSITGCVSAREADEQGKASFISGAPSASVDYQTAPAGSGGAASIGGIGGAGAVGTMPVAGMVADPAAGVGGAGGSAGTNAMAGAGGAAGAMSGGTGGGASGAGGVGPTGGMGEAGSSGTSGMTHAGSLTIDFTSAGNGGEYSPRNVGAVWIETDSGTFVKTLARWAGVRAGHLTRWTQASGGWGGGFFFASGGGNSADEMDAMTSATLRTHQEHHVTWDMQDVNDALVPDGAYRIVIEVTESERKASTSSEIEFEKGAAPVALSPPDEGPYSGLSVTYSP